MTYNFLKNYPSLYFPTALKRKTMFHLTFLYFRCMIIWSIFVQVQASDVSVFIAEVAAAWWRRAAPPRFKPRKILNIVPRSSGDVLRDPASNFYGFHPNVDQKNRLEGTSSSRRSAAPFRSSSSSSRPPRLGSLTRNRNIISRRQLVLLNKTQATPAGPFLRTQSFFPITDNQWRRPLETPTTCSGSITTNCAADEERPRTPKAAASVPRTTIFKDIGKIDGIKTNYEEEATHKIDLRGLLSTSRWDHLVPPAPKHKKLEPSFFLKAVQRGYQTTRIAPAWTSSSSLSNFHVLELAQPQKREEDSGGREQREAARILAEEYAEKITRSLTFHPDDEESKDGFVQGYLASIVHRAFQFDEVCVALIRRMLATKWDSTVQLQRAAYEKSLATRSKSRSRQRSKSSPRRGSASKSSRSTSLSGRSSSARRVATTLKRTDRDILDLEALDKIRPFSGEHLFSRGYVEINVFHTGHANAVVILDLEKLRADGFHGTIQPSSGSMPAGGDEFRPVLTTEKRSVETTELLRRSVEQILFPVSPGARGQSSSLMKNAFLEEKVEFLETNADLVWKFPVAEFVLHSGALGVCLADVLQGRMQSEMQQLQQKYEPQITHHASLESFGVESPLQQQVWGTTVEALFGKAARDGTHGAFRDAYHAVVLDQVAAEILLSSSRPTELLASTPTSESRNALQVFSFAWPALSMFDVRFHISSSPSSAGVPGPKNIVRMLEGLVGVSTPLSQVEVIHHEHSMEMRIRFPFRPARLLDFILDRKHQQAEDENLH